MFFAILILTVAWCSLVAWLIMWMSTDRDDAAMREFRAQQRAFRQARR